MAYEPTNWKTGDVVTSAKLNKLENGVANAGSGVLVANATGDETLTLDKTWQEIHDAMPLVVVSYAAQGLVGFVTMLGYRDGVYLAQFGNTFSFGAANPNDYPIDPYQP